MFSIATWNVNSLRARLPHVIAWVKSHMPDVVCLQETKISDDAFPIQDLFEEHYSTIYSGQKSYNGVAILSRKKITDIFTDIRGYEDPERRVLGATVGDVRVINLYVPNGQHTLSKKYEYKLAWLENLKACLSEEIKKHDKLIVVGDFNIAPEEIDVYNPKKWHGSVLFSDPERRVFRELLELGLTDAYRYKHPDQKKFTWWDYRLNAFSRDMGLRIDHVLISHPLESLCLKCEIDTSPRGWERPSDHAPVIAHFNLF